MLNILKEVKAKPTTTKTKTANIYYGIE